MSINRRGSLALLVLSLAILAIATRSLPLQWSALPYNIDGLSELRVSEDILTSEHLEYTTGSSHVASYVGDMPLLSLFVAFISSSIEVDPVYSFQFLSALAGTVAVLLIFLVSKRVFLSSDGAFVTGLVLATLGSFVFASGCVWKETLGIMLISLLVYSFLRRSESRFRVLVILSIPILIFTHHHSALLGLLVITFWAAIQGFSNRRLQIEQRSFETHSDIPILAMGWVLIAVYYSLIELPYLDYFSPGADLYLYVAVAGIFLLLGVKSAGSRKRFTSLPIGLVVPIAGALLMIYNYCEPIFPGIPAPSALIFVPFIAYLILVVPAWEGARIALSLVVRGRPMLLSMVLAPLSLITFAFLRAQDATSHMIIFRTFDFLMIGFAILIGLGFAHLFRGRPRAGVAGGVCLVIICASTLPIAYNSQELFGVQNHTFDFEYDAVQWYSKHEVNGYSSDQRLGEIGWRLFDIDYGRGLPYDLRESLSLNSSSFYVLEEQWSTNGAQEFPFGVVVVPAETINETLSENSVIYVGGPTDNNIICFLTRP